MDKTVDNVQKLNTCKKNVLQMGSDKMIPRHVYDELFTIKFPDRSEWKSWFQPEKKGGLISYQMVPRQETALEPGCIAIDKGGKLALALDGTQRHSRQKYMILRHAQLRI
jgi:hypothetical protein